MSQRDKRPAKISANGARGEATKGTKAPSVPFVAPHPAPSRQISPAKQKGKLATKPKAKDKPEADRPRNVIGVYHPPDGDLDAAIAQTLTKPSVNAAATIQKFQSTHEVNALARELRKQVEAVNSGDLRRAEGMLIAQAHTLDELFNNLARRAQGQEQLLQYETHFRLALKAQSQCRATLETLATIKNPPIVYARQANFANGPQQVNNGIPAQAGKIESLPNELSGASHELLQDTRAPALAGGANQEVETVGAVNRPENASG